MMVMRLHSALFIILTLTIFGAVGCSPSLNLKKAKAISSLRGRVIIDAGHGGEDGGAVGKRGLLEKDITLDIAKRVKTIFAVMRPSVDVVLTRTADRYVSLEERVSIANAMQGDAFISLHINSSEAKDARGFQMYSLDVASDRHAERLAAQENKTIGNKARGVEFILADLRAFSHRQESDRLASLVARGLKTVAARMSPSQEIIDRGNNQAIFHVLFVKMPAIIAELFFISNPVEEEMLSKTKSRDLIAKGIYMGVEKFLASKASESHASR